MFVGAEIMMWRCLEGKKKILSASAFNLYIIDIIDFLVLLNVEFIY